MNLYARYMDRWENGLATRDRNRLVRPFEWGLDWLEGAHQNGRPDAHLREFVARACADSDRFFSYEPPRDFRLDGNLLTFTSPLHSPYPENNRVHGQFFPVAAGPKRAVLVLPQWNSDTQGHVGLCRLLNRFGISALRMSLAYHDYRMPRELQRADYHVSSNLGRTIHASRQSIVDSRACLDWLESEGYERIGILGSSLGSCVAFIAATHDQRIRTGVFNHVSMNFGDVVWTGLSTKHIRASFPESFTQEDLRQYGAVISPETYLDRMAERKMKSLLIWGKYDTTFLPEYSRKVVEYFRSRQLTHRVICLPCGHYTLGQFPFNIMDGISMCMFLRRNL
jgi:hypothetical protein